MRVLGPALNSTIEQLGGTEAEKAMLIGFLENQVASAQGRVNGLRSSAADLNRQADEAEAEATALAAMLEKFTDESTVTTPVVEEPVE